MHTKAHDAANYAPFATVTYTQDEHEARLALVRRRTRQCLRLPVETILSHRAEADCEVSVALALNGIAVRVQHIDPDTGGQQVWL